MEMPVPCSKCGEWVELNSTRESELNKGKMLFECIKEFDRQLEQTVGENE